MERQAAALREGDGPEVVDEPAEDPRLLEDRAQMCLVDLVDAVEHRLDVSLDDRERRPQLVADVGQERPSLRLIRLEAGDHLVEAAGEIAHRARPALAAPRRASV